MLNLTKCTDCIHQPVCNSSEDYTKIINLFNDFEVRDKIDGELRCKHFWQEKENKR